MKKYWTMIKIFALSFITTASLSPVTPQLLTDTPKLSLIEPDAKIKIANDGTQFTEIAAGSKFKIRCAGYHLIRWTFRSPVPAINLEPPPVIIKSSDSICSPNCWLELTFRETPTADDTGMYACAYEQSDTDVSSLFIFVAEESKVILSPGNEKEAWKIKRLVDHPFTIPCLSSYESANVQLFELPALSRSRNRIKTIATSRKIVTNSLDGNVTFNNQVGFTFHNPEKYLRSGTKRFNCTASVKIVSGSSRNSVRELSNHTIFQIELIEGINPVIIEQAREARKDKIVLDVVIPDLALDVTAIWSKNGSILARTTHLANHVPTSFPSASPSDVIAPIANFACDSDCQSTLSLENEPESEGHYSWQLLDAANRTISQSEHYVCHTDNYEIKFQPSKYNFIAKSTTNATVTLYLHHVKRMSDVTSLKLFRGNLSESVKSGESISDKDRSDLEELELGIRYINVMEGRQDKSCLTYDVTVNLTLLDVKINDSGVYTVMSKELPALASFNLNIRGPPMFVTLHKGHKYFVQGREHTFSKRIISNELFDLLWMWMPCQAQSVGEVTSQFQANKRRCDDLSMNSEDEAWVKLGNYSIHEVQHSENYHTLDTNITLVVDDPGFLGVFLAQDSRENISTDGAVLHSIEAVFPMHVEQGFQVIKEENLAQGYVLTSNRSTSDIYEGHTTAFMCVKSDLVCASPVTEVEAATPSGNLVSSSVIELATNQVAEYKVSCTLICSMAAIGTQLVTFHAQKREPLRVTETNLFQTPTTSGAGAEIKFIKKRTSASLTLVCRANGEPKPRIEWYRDETRIDTITNGHYIIKDNSQILTILRLEIDDNGLYRCLVINDFGSIELKVHIMVTTSLTSMETASIVIFVSLGIAIIILGYLFGKKMRQARKLKKEFESVSKYLFNRGATELIDPDIPIDEQVDLICYDGRWEIPREQFILGKTLGQGAFGRVVEGQLYVLGSGPSGCDSIKVAVKMLKSSATAAQFKALVSELKIMSHIEQHINIVNLVAACTTRLSSAELFVIVEYCDLGNLKDFLKNCRETFVDESIEDRNSALYQNNLTVMKALDQISFGSSVMDTTGQLLRSISTEKAADRNRIPLTTSDLVSFCFQISCGMDHLSSQRVSHGKKLFLHPTFPELLKTFSFLDHSP